MIHDAYLSFTWQLEATFSNFRSQSLCGFYMINFINNHIAQYI